MRACDACYNLKERCSYSNRADNACDRCARLSRPCLRNRPRRRLGRKPLMASSILDTPTSQTSSPHNPQTIDRGLTPFGFLANSLQPCEEFIIRQLSDPSGLAGFNIAPQITASIHQQVMYTLLNHYRETHDGFISCYAAFASQKLVEVPTYPGYMDENIQRGTVALRNFRKFKPPTDKEGFVPWIWLSLCVAMHTRCALGWSASSIRRYVLSHIDQLGERKVGREMASHPIVVMMIIADIFECLLNGEMPLMNVPKTDLQHRGAFVHTCAPLFRFLFDLCMIRSARKQQEHPTLAQEQSYLSSLEKLELSVREWKPDLESDVVKSLDELGMMYLQTQIRTHILVVLLCIHRSKLDSTSGDAQALDMAHQIIWDLDCATQAGGGKAPSCVTLPFMIAAVEITNHAEQVEVLSNVNSYLTKTPFGIHVDFKTVLEDTWAWRRALEGAGKGISWTATLRRILDGQITI